MGDGSVPFSTVFGLKQNFKLINLSNQSLNIIPSNEKTTKIGSTLVVGRNTLELPAIQPEDTQAKCDTKNIQRISSTESPTGLRKRNVNWNVPIRSRFITKEMLGGENCAQSEAEIRKSNEMKLDDVTEELQRVEAVDTRRVEDVIGREPAIDDDGFESLNGKSSSGEDNAALLTINVTEGESTRNIATDASLGIGTSDHSLVSSNSLCTFRF